MNEMTATFGLPPEPGMERAAARIHQIARPREKWADLNESSRYFYRSAVGYVLRDLGFQSRSAA